jgi:ribosome recycling factor
MEFDYDDLAKKMKKHLQHFEKDLDGIKLSNRLSPDMISNIWVVPLSQQINELAQLIPKGSTEMTVKPFEEKHVDNIIIAIQGDELPLGVKKESTNSIAVTLKKPSAELKDKLTERVKQLGEGARISMRGERKKAMGVLKNLKSKNM